MTSQCCKCLIVLFVFLVTTLQGGYCLRCYVCANAPTNEACNKPETVDCEPEMDTCQTIVAYSDISEKLSIIKSCTKNISCHHQMYATADSSACDLSASSFVCTSCCYDDGCNVSSAPNFRYVQHGRVISTVAVIVSVLTTATPSALSLYTTIQDGPKKW
jgi:hypothetical protein